MMVSHFMTLWLEILDARLLKYTSPQESDLPFNMHETVALPSAGAKYMSGKTQESRTVRGLRGHVSHFARLERHRGGCYPGMHDHWFPH